GAAMVNAGPDVVQWVGIREKVLIPLVASPVAGFILGFLLMFAIHYFFQRANAGKVNSWSKRLQLLSSAYMAFVHGSNDAQKSMGIITLALVSAKLLKEPKV